MKIFITGLNSFLGRNLSIRLSQKGHLVSGTSRSEGGHQFETYTWSLDKEPSASWFSSIDVLIHLSWDLDDKTGLNIKGTERIAQKALEAGVKKQIFVSSCSAHNDAKSRYGIEKKICEAFFLNRNFFVVRPGLILGDGGGFKTVLDLLKKSRMIPVFDSGKQLVPAIGIQDLCTAIEKIVAMPSSQNEFNIFYASPPSFKNLVRETASILGGKVFLFSINSSIMLLVLTFFNFFKVRLPVSKEQLLGYRANKVLHFSPTLIDGVDLNKPLRVAISESLKSEL